MNVTILVMMTGRELIKKPYKIHRNMPAQNSMNIPAEMSFVDLVFQVLITCGINEMVVRVPAAMPRNVTASMIPIVPLKLLSPYADADQTGSAACRSALLAVIVFHMVRPKTRPHRDEHHCRTYDPDMPDRSDAALSNSCHDHERKRIRGGSVLNVTAIAQAYSGQSDPARIFC